MSDAYKELLKLTGFERQSTMPEEQYLTLLLNELAGISDSAWDKLSHEAQKWVADSADIINRASEEGTDAVLPYLIGFPYHEEAVEEADDNEVVVPEEALIPDELTPEEGPIFEEDPEVVAELEETGSADVEIESVSENKYKVKKRKKIRPPVPHYMVIKVRLDHNPHKEGTRAHDKWNLLVDGMTVKEYREASYNREDLNYAGKKGRQPWAGEYLKDAARLKRIEIVHPRKLYGYREVGDK